ncbi:hypothetical protein QE152_g1758 [Popillia japonica]|uniref:Uncharacterized protein n=1 Tax=Popillia japonica TaxID=7064 RepID=A0AAW1N5F9_POPJA
MLNTLNKKDSFDGADINNECIEKDEDLLPNETWLNEKSDGEAEIVSNNFSVKSNETEETNVPLHDILVLQRLKEKAFMKQYKEAKQKTITCF